MSEDIVVELRKIATLEVPINQKTVLLVCIHAINEIESLRNTNKMLKEAIFE